MKNKERLEKLFQEISKEARKEVEKIREKASSRIDELEKQFKEEKNKYFKEQKAKIDRREALHKQQQITKERLEEKKKILNRKRELIEKVFDIAVEKLKNTAEKKKQKFFKTMLDETVNSGAEVVRPAGKSSVITESFIKKVNKEKNWELKLGSAIKSQSGGFLLEGENSETVVDWKNIKEYLKEKEEDNIIRELFGSNDD
ncbi:MAG: V-type ATP synthase subunit E family protein [Elusimicrobiota bacterium]